MTNKNYSNQNGRSCDQTDRADQNRSSNQTNRTGSENNSQDRSN